MPSKVASRCCNFLVKAAATKSMMTVPVFVTIHRHRVASSSIVQHRPASSSIVQHRPASDEPRTVPVDIRNAWKRALLPPDQVYFHSRDMASMRNSLSSSKGYDRCDRRGLQYQGSQSMYHACKPIYWWQQWQALRSPWSRICVVG
jgi:hypothetical protein